MKRYSLVAVAGLMMAACQQNEGPAVLSDDISLPPSTDWVSLFSGGDLSNFNKIGDANWQIIDNFVEADGGKHSFLVSRDHYRDFELHVEFWPSPDANSGVFLRCQDPTAIANESCYELNIYDQHSNPDNATGSIINLAPPRVAIETGNNWNSYDVSISGSHIVVKLNDVVVIDFKDESFSDGPIGLQSNGGLIRFRNIRVRPLAN